MADGKSKASKPVRYHRAHLKQLCWGMLLYMLGDGEAACEILKPLAKKNPANCPSDEIIRTLAQLTTRHRQALHEQRGGVLKELVTALGLAIDPTTHTIPRLGHESQRCEKYREADEGPSLGYSRYPFKKIQGDNAPEIALAAICYVARAHSLFFCHPRAARNFEIAKQALNDLFQASQLGCRLYYALPCSHVNHITGLQEEYVHQVQSGADVGSCPWESPLFIWSLLQLVDINRGHIYRHIHYLDEADRYYRRVQQRFDRRSHDPLSKPEIPFSVLKNKDEIKLRNGMSLAVFFALIERSKILFDRGNLIESMMIQLRCLRFLVTMASQKRNSNQNIKQCSILVQDLSNALQTLNIVRRESIWDKEIVTTRFGGPSKSIDHRLRTARIGVITVARLVPWLKCQDDVMRKAGTELLARLGFSLWILRRGQLPIRPWNKRDRTLAHREQATVASWLRPFFSIHKQLNISQSPMAQYCLSLVEERAESTAVTLQDSIERQLALRLRETIAGYHYQHPLSEDAEFYASMLEKVTHNISNIVTIPRRLHAFLMRGGYKQRRSIGSFSGERLSAVSATPSPTRVRNKLVVLRRWQSFNPKVPRPSGQHIRGGGYYLLWQGKGIVIDPGYDFIQNFYDEGFSLDDIHGVAVTHSHPDHDDDLSTLTTLVREWNEYYRYMGEGDNGKIIKLDFFLNESTHLKFSSWLKASSTGIGRVIPLPLVVWDKDSKEANERPEDLIRGKNVFIALRQKYSLDLEIVPAWHDDVIGKTASVGLKFHLYSDDKEKKPIGVIGYTGDTGAYGDIDCGGDASATRLLIERQYAGCDVLIAHLGDIRIRELSTAMSRAKPGIDIAGSCIKEVLSDWFCENGSASHRLVTPERVQAFFSLMISLNLASTEALDAALQLPGGESQTVSGALNGFVHRLNKRIKTIALGKLKEQLLKQLETVSKEDRPFQIETNVLKCISEAAPYGANRNYRLSEWRVVYSLLGFLCATSSEKWTYDYHLGASGIYRLHAAMVEDCELPEELTSYRHHVARLLNTIKKNWPVGQQAPKVHTFTGDIGLHVSLSDPVVDASRKKLNLQVRCSYCNYNNETVLKLKNYHSPSKMYETPLKRLQSSLIYLCTEHDHHVEDTRCPADFLYRPNLSLV
jgi:ribonuclease BN (tRNA processing enzyme)